jgi:hypothetical protein
MLFGKKFVALAAVVGCLACVSTASAGFTPPTNIAPFLPAANQATVTQTGTLGGLVIYSCSMGGTIMVAKGTPLAQVVVKAEGNCSWQKFLVATVPASDRTNPAVVQAATLWWTQNIYAPYYAPLLNGASVVTKTSSLRAGAVRR